MVKTKEEVIEIAHSVLFNKSITPFQRDAITSLIEFRAKGVSLDELRKVLNKLSDKKDTTWDYHDALYDIEQVFFPSPKSIERKKKQMSLDTKFKNYIRKHNPNLDSPALKINKRGGD